MPSITTGTLTTASVSLVLRSVVSHNLAMTWNHTDRQSTLT